MDLQGDLDIVGMHGPGRPTLARGSVPPQMQMMNGVGGPRTGPGGPMMMARRPTLMQSRPFPIGMGVIRILELSKELSSMKDVSVIKIYQGFVLTRFAENVGRLVTIQRRIFHAIG
jgi:hypothetical protein